MPARRGGPAKAGGGTGAVDGRGRAQAQFQGGQRVAVGGVDQQGRGQLVAAVGAPAEQDPVGLGGVAVVVKDRPVVDQQGVLAGESSRARRPAAWSGATRVGKETASLAKKRQAAWVLAKAAVRRGRAAGPAASGARSEDVRLPVGRSGVAAAVRRRHRKVIPLLYAAALV